MGRQQKPAETGIGWLKCALWGILMTPLTMLLIYLTFGFMPERLEQLVRGTMLEYPFLFGLVFYLCGVVAYHWVGLDLSKREDWPDIPG